MNPNTQTDKYGLKPTSEYTGVNPNFQAPTSQRVADINAQIKNSPLGSKGISVAPSEIPKVISSDLLSTNVAPLNLPTITTPNNLTAGASIQGLTEGLNTNSQNIISQEQAKINEAKQAVQTSTSGMKSLIDKLTGKGQAQIQEEEKQGLSAKAQELTQISNEYNTKNLEYRRMEEAVMKEGTLTDVQKNAKLREISRVKNTELADIGIKQAVAQNNLKTTQDLIDRKIDLEYGDLKDLINYQGEFLKMNLDILSKAEQNNFNLILQENERKYNEGVKIGEFAKQVASNGADSYTISKVSNAKTMAEAVQNAGQFAGDVLERQIKQAQLAKLQTDAKKAVQEIGTPISTTGELAKAQAKGNIDLISGLTNDKYLPSAVGPNTFTRTSLLNSFTGGKSNFIAGVEQLSSQLSLDSLIRAKANGATFGALSDSELKILSASASKLGTWALKDDNGNVIGYKTSESEFKKEMDKINNFAKLDYLIKGGNYEDVGAKQLDDGTIWVTNSDGSFTKIYP